MTNFAPPSFDSVFASVHALTDLSVQNMEKLAGLQLASLQSYVALAIDQLKAAAAARSAEELQELAGKQAALLKTLGDKLVADAQQLMQLGVQFNTEVQKVVLDGGKALTPTA